MDTVQNSNNCCQCIYNSTDNEKVLKRFSYLASLYTYLKRHFHVSRILLFRNLSYIRENRIYQELKHETSLNEICESLLINKSESQLMVKKTNLIYNLKINGFFDGDSECEWETVQASASVIVVHQWKNRRKNKSGSKSIELLSNISFKCNNFLLESEDESFKFTKDQLFQDTSQFRISYSYILFKIKAFERKKRSQHAYSDVNGKLEESARVFPVNYETRFPIYKRDSDRYLPDSPDGSCDYLVDGEYELRLDVSEDQPTEDISNSMTTNQLISQPLIKPTGSILHDPGKTEHPTHNGTSSNDKTIEQMEIDTNLDENEAENDANDGDDDDYYDDDDSNILESFDRSLPVWISESANTNNPSNAKVKEYSKWPKIKFNITTSDVEESESDNKCASNNNSPDKVHSHQNGSVNGVNTGPYNEHVIKTINGVLKSLEEDLTSVNASHQTNGCVSKLTNLKRKKMKPLTVITNGYINSASRKAVEDHSSITVAYKMMNKDRLIQWTYSISLKCPWCGFNRFQSIKLDYGIHCLMKHLRTFHARFSYQCYTNSQSQNQPQTDKSNPLFSQQNQRHLSPSSYTIEIRLNDSYDGSIEVGLRQYTDNVHLDLQYQPHHYSSVQRRQNYTQLIYSKLIFQPVYDKVQGLCADLKPVSHGHNREYFHSATGLTQTVLDLDTDSETEDIPPWLEYQYRKRLEEFMDVNPGEKRVMQLWNEHLLKFKYHGDYALPNLLNLFIQTNGSILKEEKLRNNLILHLSNLVDYGLLSANQFLDAINKYDSL